MPYVFPQDGRGLSGPSPPLYVLFVRGRVREGAFNYQPKQPQHRPFTAVAALTAES